MWNGSIGSYEHSEFVLQLNNPKLRKYQSFKSSARNMSNFALKGDIIFIILVRKQICPLPWRETIFLSSKNVCLETIHDNVVKKTVNALALLRNVQKCKQPMDNCIPTIN